MIKICHITSVHQRYDTRIFQKECKALSEAGYDVHLIVADDKLDEIIDHVQIHSTHNMYKSRLQRMLTASRQVLKIGLKVDAEVYHFHDPELLPVAMKMKKKGKKVIFDSHEATAEQIKIKPYLPKWIRNVVAFFYRKYELYVIQKIDAVIFPCLYDGKDYFEGKYRKMVYIDNFPIVTNGIDKAVYNKESKYVCYVGALSEARGINQIIKAAEKAEVKLVLAGNGMDKDSVTSEYLDYKGIVSHDEAVNIILNSYAGLCILQKSGQYQKAWNLATKMYEYMLAGIPVIMSDFPYYKRVNEEKQFGICVEPDNIDEIAEAMDYLKKHVDEAEEMGQRGRELVLEKFNWKNEAKKLVELYNGL